MGGDPCLAFAAPCQAGVFVGRASAGAQRFVEGLVVVLDADVLGLNRSSSGSMPSDDRITLTKNRSASASKSGSSSQTPNSRPSRELSVPFVLPSHSRLGVKPVTSTTPAGIRPRHATTGVPGGTSWRG